jgi:hypothetical protein
VICFEQSVEQHSYVSYGMFFSFKFILFLKKVKFFYFKLIFFLKYIILIYF